MITRRITIRELAEKLSLSATTVSLSLSGRGEAYRIAPATRERIRAAAEEEGYRPNHMARSVRRGKSDTIGVLFPDIGETYMNRMLAGIEAAALERGVGLMIATSSLKASVESRNLESLLDRRIDGLILVPYAPFRGEDYADTHIRRALNTGTPAVALDRYIPGVTPYAVIGDDRAAACSATGLLLASGCRRPAYLGFDLEITTLEERRAGFHEAVETARSKDIHRLESQKNTVEILLAEHDERSSDLRDRLADMAALGELPDAFLVSTEGLALKLRSLLREMNRFPGPGNTGPGGTGSGGRSMRGNSVRGSRSVHGGSVGKKFHSDPFPLIARFGEDSPWFPTGMISIRQPHFELGRRGTEKLFDILDGKNIPEGQHIETLKMEIQGPEVREIGETE